MKVAHSDRYSREDIVGRYRLLNHVARSQTCDIWEALHVSTNRRHALKLMLPSVSARSEATRALRHEFTVGSTLKHPAVIRMDEFLRDDGVPLIAMEYFANPTLKGQIRERHEALLPLAVKIVEQATAGLAHLHDQGWIHRDVKPENYLVSDTGEVRLIDFSLAQRPPRWWNSLFGGGASAIQGTRTYLSPEQIRKQRLDARSDIYSLGCVFFELFAGKPPYAGNSSGELLSKHLKAPIPSLRAARSEVTPALSQLVGQMMAKVPDDRPTSMSEVLEQIRGSSVLERRAVPESGPPE
ncbi:MAG: serine/threonine protein kinase [Planctomycetota bacterium]|nr:MAG: serine/threonine protein kinase [Planctomycetota bacterium]REK40679.1 MAG: serine/threonine protein kinase [Planctomycetota bacterium]